MLSRRSLILGAPAIVAAASLMRLRGVPLVGNGVMLTSMEHPWSSYDPLTERVWFLIQGIDQFGQPRSEHVAIDYKDIVEHSGPGHFIKHYKLNRQTWQTAVVRPVTAMSPRWARVIIG